MMMKVAPTKILSDVCEPQRHWLMLPSDLRKWGQAMLHQQCWCWGQDIKRGEGNLLIEHGFGRTRAPKGYKGSPTYHKRLDDHRAVTLWGFGMCYAEAGRGAVFLSRYGFAPRFSASHEISRQAWKAEHLSEFRAPHTPAQCQESLRLLAAALCWLADYEARVLADHGADYRTRTLKQWSHAVLKPNEVPSEWQRLSALCRQRALIWTRDATGIRHALAQELATAH
jgi:hypothetical protein